MVIASIARFVLDSREQDPVVAAHDCGGRCMHVDMELVCPVGVCVVPAPRTSVLSSHDLVSKYESHEADQLCVSEV